MTAVDIAGAARALVTRTTAAQGLPEQIGDLAILARVASIITAGRDAAPGHHSGAGITITTTADPTCRKGDARGPS